MGKLGIFIPKNLQNSSRSGPREVSKSEDSLKEKKFKIPFFLVGI